MPGPDLETLLVLVSEKSSDNPMDGHYFTMTQALSSSAKKRGVAFEVWRSGEAGEAAFNAVSRKDTGLVCVRIPAQSSFHQAFRQKILVAYEGEMSNLPDLLKVQASSGCRVVFNFLRSVEFVELWAYLQLRPKGLNSTLSAIRSLSVGGFAMLADTRELSTRLLSLGFPVRGIFPAISAFSGTRNFSDSKFDFGILFTRSVDAGRVRRLIRKFEKSGVNLEKVKVLSASEALMQVAAKRFSSLPVVVDCLPKVGVEYPKALDAKIWLTNFRDNHLVFGSSGRILDIVSNGGQVITYRWSGADSMLSGGAAVKTASPFRFKSGYLELLSRPCKSSEQFQSGTTLLEEVLSTPHSGTVRGESTFNYDLVRLEVEEFMRFRKSRPFRLLVRILFRIPRSLLWKVTSGEPIQKR